MTALIPVAEQEVERVSDAAPVKEVVRFIQRYPEFDAAYRELRKNARILSPAAYYELTSRCNLRCEGCFYFDGGYDQNPEESDLQAWDQLFASEAARGVRFVYLVGAEPSLVPERLAAANRHFTYGLIGSNGLKRIDPEISFKIHLSVWGDERTDRELRGAPAFRKALRNYRGEDRALVLYTLSRRNIDQARGVLEDCRDQGLKLTFNMFSPTAQYLRQLQQGALPAGNRFFRVSSAADNLLWDEDSLRRKRDTVAELIEDFPQTLVYSQAYNEWVTQPGSLFDIDPGSGVARNCNSRVGPALKLFDTSARSAAVKCCTSDVDCSRCRMYSGGLASRLRPSVADIQSREAFSRYLAICQHMFGIYVYEPDWVGA